MNNKFTVIKPTQEEYDEETKRVYRIAILNEAWERQYLNAISESCENRAGKISELPQSELMKIGLSGVKYICSFRDVKQENERLHTGYVESLEESKIKYQVIDSVLTVLSSLTLRNFVITFPIKKDFDGHKWESKDYFYTMDVLSKMDWNKPIGRDKIFDFLWDYVNEDLQEACIEYMCTMSAIYRSQTGRGIAEQWLSDKGVPSYTIDEDTGIMKNNQTGEIAKIKKSSHIQIVK